MATGLAKNAAAPAVTTNSSQMPSWMTGEAPTPAPRKKKPRIDSGGQLSRGSMRMA
jgi:hypothetical protein